MISNMWQHLPECTKETLRQTDNVSYIAPERLNRFGLVSLFNGKSTFVGYLMPKPSFLKNSSGTI